MVTQSMEETCSRIKSLVMGDCQEKKKEHSRAMRIPLPVDLLTCFSGSKTASLQ